MEKFRGWIALLGLLHFRRGQYLLLQVIRPKMVILTSVLFIIAYAVTFTLSVGRKTLPSKYTDPFAAYDEILPGQPIAALTAHNCGPLSVDLTSLVASVLPITCKIYESARAIPLITVIFERGVVQSLVFNVKGLQFADVIQRWGAPDILEKTPGFYIARWEEGVYVTGGLTNEFSYHAPVHVIILS